MNVRVLVMVRCGGRMHMQIQFVKDQAEVQKRIRVKNKQVRDQSEPYEVGKTVSVIDKQK